MNTVQIILFLTELILIILSIATNFSTSSFLSQLSIVINKTAPSHKISMEDIKPIAKITEIMTDTKAGKPTNKIVSSTAPGTNNSRFKSNKWGKRTPSSNTSTFQGANVDLAGKVFVKGPLQAAKYDEAYKAILTYIGSNYDHRVYKAFEYKDKSKGLNLLTKPTAPKIKKIIQEATIGLNSVLIGKEVEVIDKDGEAYVEYQLYLKQYLSDGTKFNSDIEKLFSLLLGQCSPSMEQSLAGEKNFKDIKEKSDSIALIQVIERICYNYQSHEFAPLSGWDSLDRLTAARQPDDVLESEHYEKFKTIIEVCKASGINFSVMCSANVDMAIKSLNLVGEISTSGTYKDGTYFKLTEDERELVDQKAEEICLATRFLSLSSNKLHSQSKQELQNDLIKEDDKYPRTITAALNFLQYHSLRNNNTSTRVNNPNPNRIETAFAQDGTKNTNDEVKPFRNISKTCRQFEEGDCPFKTKHTWKECPNNPWGINKGKSCDSSGAIIMCTVGDVDDATNDNLTKPDVMFYAVSYSNSFRNISLKRQLYLLMIKIRCSIKHNTVYLLIKNISCPQG